MPVISHFQKTLPAIQKGYGLLQELTEREINQKEIRNYYTEAAEDYGAWSTDFNMHFGFYKKGMNPFDREQLLDQMNAEVLARLDLDPEKAGQLLDLGCGLGATSRHAAKNYPAKKITAITLVPRQVELGKGLHTKAGLENRIETICADYTNTPLPSGCAEAAFAVESACHDQGPDKPAFIGELHRLLKPGGRFAIADGFVLKSLEEFPPLMKTAYKQLCHHWAVPEMAQLDLFIKRLEAQGFENIQVEDLFWKVFPSAAHIPAVTLRFLWGKMFAKEKWTAKSRGHLKACVLSIPLGLYRPGFSHFMVTGNKAN